MNSNLASIIVPTGLILLLIGFMHFNAERGYLTWKQFFHKHTSRFLHPRITKAHEEALAEDFNRENMALMDLEDLYFFGSPAQKAAWVAPSWLTDDEVPSSR